MSNPESILPYLGYILSIITFVLGFFVSRLSLTKKEREDVKLARFANAKQLVEAQQKCFQDFCDVLRQYNAKTGEPTIDDFYSIATAGERYFYQQKIISDAILSGTVMNVSRDLNLVPSIEEAVSRSLPSYYKTLRTIAKKRGFEYHGELKRANYEGMYRVVEKYGKGYCK